MTDWAGSSTSTNSRHNGAGSSFRTLRGDPAAREELPALLRDRLLGQAKRLAPGLARHGLAEDIVQAMWLHLLVLPAGHFNPRQASAMTYLQFYLRWAAQTVGAEHRRGRPTRRVHDEESDEIVFEALVYNLGGVVSSDGGDALSGEETLVDVHGEDLYGPVLDRVEVEHILRLAATTAPTSVLIALCAIQDGATMTAASVRVGLSRFALRRAIDSWVEAQSITR
jgi:hypothetical protein